MVAEVVGACAGSAAITGWALYLGCGPVLLGLLGALPFLSHLVQLPAAWVTSVLGRRRVAIATIAASRQAVLPLVALPFLRLEPAAGRAVLLAVAGTSAALGVVGNNAWTAWVGDLVPERLRGRYFGRRTAVCTAAGMAAALVAGLGLDRGHRVGHGGTALAALAAVASVCGLGTTLLMTMQHEPRRAPAAPLDLAGALRPLVDPEVRPFIGYLVVWNAAVGVSGSFFSVHLLQNLRVGYAGLALHGALASTTRVLSAPFWGRALDRAGARPVLAACSFGLAAAPIIWMVPTEASPWPIAIDAVLSGTLFAGHALASFSLPLSAAPRANRPFYLAVFATAGGVSYAAASAAGGFLASLLPARFDLWGRGCFALHALFAISAAARLVSGFLAIRIVEPRAGSMGELRLVARGAVADLRGRFAALLR